MTDSRNRRGRGLGASAAGLLLAALASGPAGYAAAVAAPMQPDGSPSAGAGRSSARVESDRLADVSVDSTGVLGPGDRALPPEMWRDTPSSLVDALLPRLPVASPSPATRALMRRLLLSAAVPPAGDGEAGRFLERRARLLWRMNDADGLFRLSAAVPASARSSRLTRLETDARLLSGDLDGACGVARARIDGDSDVYWQKVLGFCQAARGETDEAALTLALLAEREEDVGAYRILLQALEGGVPASAIPKLRDPTPLDLAMLRASGNSPQPEAARSDDLAVLAAIARSEPFAGPIRLAAGQRAVAAGALPGEDVLPLYALAPPAKAPVTARRAVPPVSPVPSAEEFVRAAVDADPAARVEAAARALEAGRRQGRWLETVQLVAPWLAGAEPAGRPPTVARQVVPAMLVLGDRARATAWLGDLADRAAASADADETLSALLPLARLALLPQGRNWRPESLVDNWQTEQARPGGRARVALALALLQATGETIPDSLWVDLLQGPSQATGPGVDIAFRTQLDRASRAGRVGETVLLVLVASGAVGTETLGAASLATLVGGLRTVGLRNDALAFALEGVASR